MIKRFLTLTSIFALLAFSVACEKNGEDDGKDEDKKEEEQTPSEETQEPLPTAFLTAVETVNNMGAGWNLGNTLDSNSGALDNMWIEAWTDKTPTAYEKAWGQAPATRELFHMLKQKGFKSIRVPVTWYPHMGKITIDYKTVGDETKPTWDQSTWVGDDVNPVWMKRVKEVVDYVLAEDMYCILNVHHDTGTATTHWIVADEANYAQYKDKFKNLWKQIAETFKDYDGRLLFEGYNEMTDVANSWCFASLGTGSYDASIAKSAYNAVNAYAQDFVDVVRATGGNNAERNLVVCTYAACSGQGNWNSHLQDPLYEMKLPKDSAKDHILFEVHFYPEFETYDAGKWCVDDLVDNLNKHLVSKGAPVIVGEWGAGENSKVKYGNYTQTFLKFAEYMAKHSKENGIATFYWMGITDGPEARTAPKFTQEDLAEAIIKGAK